MLQRGVDPHSGTRRRLIVPLVLAVTIAGTVAAAVATSTGCGSDKPKRDAGTDSPIDTPLV